MRSLQLQPIEERAISKMFCMTWLAMASTAFGQMPPMPDLEGLAESLADTAKDFKWHGHAPFINEPRPVLPTARQIQRMPGSESVERTHFFVSAFVSVFLVVVILGTLILHFGPQLKSSSWFPYRALSLEEGSAVSSSSQSLSSERQKWLGAISFGAAYVVSLVAVVWSILTGRLSKSSGLDWELYLVLFSLVGVWQVVQAVGAVVLADPSDSYELSTFGMASFLSMMPFLSDYYDSVKDVIFGGLCMQSEYAVLKIVGVASWIYLLAIHVYFFMNPNSLAELTGTYLSVLVAAPKPKSDASPGAPGSM